MTWTADEPLYTLIVVDVRGNEHRIYGSRAELEPHFRKWSEGTFDEGRVTVWGIRDDACHTVAAISIKAEEIAAIHFYRQD